MADWPPDEALKKVAEDSYKVLDPLRRTELTQAVTRWTKHAKHAAVEATFYVII